MTLAELSSHRRHVRLGSCACSWRRGRGGCRTCPDLQLPHVYTSSGGALRVSAARGHTCMCMQRWGPSPCSVSATLCQQPHEICFTRRPRSASTMRGSNCARRVTASHAWCKMAARTSEPGSPCPSLPSSSKPGWGYGVSGLHRHDLRGKPAHQRCTHRQLHQAPRCGGRHMQQRSRGCRREPGRSTSEAWGGAEWSCTSAP